MWQTVMMTGNEDRVHVGENHRMQFRQEVKFSELARQEETIIRTSNGLH